MIKSTEKIRQEAIRDRIAESHTPVQQSGDWKFWLGCIVGLIALTGIIYLITRT